ncbi:MAG TPA: DUF1552 domain-containing protein [Polyangiaceae bacterium]|nr:DUF1552 domain-containing protein [Polyangiaceae bacterium]
MTEFSRRRLLQGLGAGAALSLPFLRATPSMAAGSAPPKRFAVFFSANEPINKGYWDPGVKSGAALPNKLPDMMSPLEPFLSKLNIIGDLKLKTRDVDPHKGGHTGIGHTLTGRINSPFPNASSEGQYWAGGISLDQYLAQKMGVEALTLGAMPGGGSSGASRISSLGKDQPVHPIDDPKKAFDKLFANFNLSEADAAKLRAQKKSVLDVVAKDIARLKQRLPSTDREKIDIHLGHIQAIETKLGEVSQISCSPQNPSYPSGYDYKSNKWLPTTARLQMDILAQALACGITNVATFQLGNSGSSQITPMWPEENMNVNNSYHNVAHDWNTQSAGEANRKAIEKWNFKMFAYMLEKLDSIPEAGGTVLDNTVVLYAKPIGTKHSPYPMLYILAGKAGGNLQTGRYLSFDQVPHNNLLTSICNLMGYNDAKFGDPNICTGALAL